jgi:hypothetical protein
MQIDRLAPAALHWFETSRKMQVYQPFRRSCNLVNERDELIALVSEARGLGPFAAFVPGSDFSGVEVGTPVGSAEGVLRLGSRNLRWAGSRLWDPQPDWERAQAGLQHGVPELAGVLHGAPEDSLAWALDVQRAQTRFQVAAASPIAQLLMGLSAGHAPDIRAGAGVLAGLGPGLTPAGDDFLVGAMFGLRTRYPKELADRLAGEILEAVQGRVSRLSHAWLKAAARGEAAWPWHGLVAALAEKDRAAVHRAGENVMRTGHTSGADALAGFLGVLGE